MNNMANFDDHIENVCSKVKQKSSWILRTFQTRQPFVLKQLWKQLVQPHIDYCSQMMVLTPGNISDLENLQRSYLSRIPSLKNKDYWERLKDSQMLSQERRLERYKIIYIWKIIEGRVPNCGVTALEHPRHGRLCIVPPIKNCATRVKTLRENSFQVQGPILFNSLPAHIRNKKKCSIDEFKLVLDKFLELIPDEPNVNGTHYTPRASCQITGKASNKLVNQIKLLNSGGHLFGA